MAYLNQFQDKHLEYLEDLIHLTDICALDKDSTPLSPDQYKDLCKDLSEILCKESICKDNRSFGYFIEILWQCKIRGYSTREAIAYWINDQEVRIVTDVMISIIVNAIEVCPKVTAAFDKAINGFIGGRIQKATLKIHRDHFKTLLE
jgi:hypothetical protein